VVLQAAGAHAPHPLTQADQGRGQTLVVVGEDQYALPGPPTRGTRNREARPARYLATQERQGDGVGVARGGVRIRALVVVRVLVLGVVGVVVGGAVVRVAIVGTVVRVRRGARVTYEHALDVERHRGPRSAVFVAHDDVGDRCEERVCRGEQHLRRFTLSVG